MNNSVLRASKLCKTYDNGPCRTPILFDVDLILEAGETVAVIGVSGSGKSTLLHCLSTLDRPSSGQVFINGNDPFQLSEAKRSALRNHALGFIYQFHHLLAEFTAQENVAMPLLIRRQHRSSALASAQTVLEAVGLGHRLKHRPRELSGGERQRTAIARALVTRPACVFADEPTGNLDRDTASSVFQLMLRLNQEFGTSFVIVTHDPDLAALCHRQCRLAHGRLSAVYTHPT